MKFDNLPTDACDFLVELLEIPNGTSQKKVLNNRSTFPNALKVPGRFYGVGLASRIKIANDLPHVIVAILASDPNEQHLTEFTLGASVTGAFFWFYCLAKHNYNSSSNYNSAWWKYSN